MKQKRAGNVAHAVFGFTSATALFACAPANNEYSLTEGTSAQVLGKSDALTAAEWSTYMANQRYMRSLVKPNATVRVNHADSRQHALVLARLQLAGKTAKNSPYLFQLLEERRKEHLAAGHKVGVLNEPEVSSISARHRITNATAGTAARINIAAAGAAVGAAASTFPGGAYYSYLDVSYSTASGYPLADLDWTEEFEREGQTGLVGADVAVRTIANPALSNERKWTVSSFKFEDSAEGFITTYTATDVGSDSPVHIAEAIDMSRIAIQSPADTFGNDGVISLCVNRQWTNDCDEILPSPNGYWDVRIPLKGWVVINSGHKFDRAEIDDIRATLERGVEHPMAGTMDLLLTQHGGGCTAIDTQVPLTGRMVNFWRNVTLAPGDRTLSWDLTGNKAAEFDRTCAYHDNAKLTVRLPLTLLEPPNYLTTTITSLAMSTDPRELPPDPGGNEDGEIKPIVITNSCLAEGTQIATKGGKQVAIESLKIGQAVSNPYDRSDKQLTITDTAKGVEPVPMVRIRDEAGRTLLLTEMHPISTPDRGMVQARWLRTGDVVETATGAAKLTEVSREPYSGHVYNLKVGDEAEMQQLGADQTIVYANGFVVGDGQIQSKYEAIALKQETTSTIANIPAQWKQDYQLSKERAKQ
jgi:hypothetical protein